MYVTLMWWFLKGVFSMMVTVLDSVGRFKSRHLILYCERSCQHECTYEGTLAECKDIPVSCRIGDHCLFALPGKRLQRRRIARLIPSSHPVSSSWDPPTSSPHVAPSSNSPAASDSARIRADVPPPLS